MIGWIKVDLVLNDDSKNWCTKPFGKNLKGCPDCYKEKGCPPNSLNFKDLYDLNDVYVIYSKFDLTEYPRPGNITSWLNDARLSLNEAEKQFKDLYPDYIIETKPEAMGIDMTKTMESVGIILEWPPHTAAYFIRLAGKKL